MRILDFGTKRRNISSSKKALRRKTVRASLGSGVPDFEVKNFVFEETDRLFSKKKSELNKMISEGISRVTGGLLTKAAIKTFYPDIGSAQEDYAYLYTDKWTAVRIPGFTALQDEVDPQLLAEAVNQAIGAFLRKHLGKAVISTSPSKDGIRWGDDGGKDILDVYGIEFEVNPIEMGYVPEDDDE